jgi:hypothetical protein
VVEVMPHEAAHALATRRGIKDTSAARDSANAAPIWVRRSTGRRRPQPMQVSGSLICGKAVCAHWPALIIAGDGLSAGSAACAPVDVRVRDAHPADARSIQRLADAHSGRWFKA